MNAFLRSRTLAWAVGLACGGLAAVGAWRDPGAPGAPRDDLAAGDVLRDAMDAWAAGDHVVVAPGSSALLAPEEEAEVERVVAEEGAPLYVLVVEQSWNAGYAQAGHALDQLMAAVEVDGVVVIWEGDGNGDVALTGHRTMPPSYRLEEAGVVLAPQDAAVYDRISSYEMLGRAEDRLTEWARAIPPDITAVEATADEPDDRRGDAVLGVVAGVLAGLAVSGVLWILVGIVRVRTGRSFANQPLAGGSPGRSSSDRSRPVDLRKRQGRGSGPRSGREPRRPARRRRR
ncbi:hypothetical protein INN71_07885 [Nocardioides sp. ChNu-153]|uniref:hypothetical protein n=1 Tax=unclassified Nocardioides TaxID=2615069 RepID=UPI002406280D|nr:MULTISPECIES: hypothetical protein [unclassified Nocardioides]MDF9715639.1 hypothetical protein [Nocardioides sp. ChNu-99]MDN7121311.1 hypothetical protein [Nocardioides sp. ChNu-153]